MPRLVIVICPAHNEEQRLPAMLETINQQTVPPDSVVVIADNCTDDTASVATSYNATVFTTHGNTLAKAGALNQWLTRHLPELPDDCLLLVVDGDGILDHTFIETALTFHASGYSAVGGVFRGERNGTLVGWFQCMEYERYRYLLRRSRGRTLVLTGTATLMPVSVLREVVAAREAGTLPTSGAAPEQVYSYRTLVEDLELTLAIKHLHHDVIAPVECSLTTETMPTWRALTNQRYRWKLGALQTAWDYGRTEHTWVFHRLQLINLIGIIATITYIITFGLAAVTGNVHIHNIWIAVTGIYVIERTTTVAGLGPRAVLTAAPLLLEMVYDITLQATQLRAILDWTRGHKQQDWYRA